jgi:hypothetical protein
MNATLVSPVLNSGHLITPILGRLQMENIFFPTRTFEGLTDLNVSWEVMSFNWLGTTNFLGGIYYLLPHGALNFQSTSFPKY